MMSSTVADPWSGDARQYGEDIGTALTDGGNAVTVDATSEQIHSCASCGDTFGQRVGPLEVAVASSALTRDDLELLANVATTLAALATVYIVLQGAS